MAILHRVSGPDRKPPGWMGWLCAGAGLPLLTLVGLYLYAWWSPDIITLGGYSIIGPHCRRDFVLWISPPPTRGPSFPISASQEVFSSFPGSGGIPPAMLIFTTAPPTGTKALLPMRSIRTKSILQACGLTWLTPK